MHFLPQNAHGGTLAVKAVLIHRWHVCTQILEYTVLISVIDHLRDLFCFTVLLWALDNLFVQQTLFWTISHLLSYVVLRRGWSLPIAKRTPQPWWHVSVCNHKCWYPWPIFFLDTSALSFHHWMIWFCWLWNGHGAFKISKVSFLAPTVCEQLLHTTLLRNLPPFCQKHGKFSNRRVIFLKLSCLTLYCHIPGIQGKSDMFYCFLSNGDWLFSIYCEFRTRLHKLRRKFIQSIKLL